MTQKTLYILGAGFSKHFGFPLAGDLKSEIFDNPECRDAWGRDINVPSIIEKAFKAYQKYETELNSGAEEFWMHIKKEEPIREAQSLDSRSPEFWLIKYFPFAICEFFYKKTESVTSIPEAYTKFFKNLCCEPGKKDAVLYMNWDTIPELYCGFSYTQSFNTKNRPYCAPVSASSLSPDVKWCAGAIPVYRPAGGIHLYELPLNGRITTPPEKCFQLLQDPNIYCARFLDKKFWHDLRTQAGDDWTNQYNEKRNLNFMIFPGADPSQNHWVKGQLKEAAKDLKTSSRVVIIGYRFPSYDAHMQEWLKEQKWSGKEVVVVNPEEGQETYKYLKDTCEGAVVKLEPKKFEDSSFAI